MALNSGYLGYIRGLGGSRFVGVLLSLSRGLHNMSHPYEWFRVSGFRVSGLEFSGSV